MLTYSIIIPHKDSISTLKRLFDSIPVRDDLEIIVVDNSPRPVSKSDIGIDREYELLYSEPKRYAGGARNVGLEKASGMWIMFADADDFYARGAFDAFDSMAFSNSDLIYFKADAIYEDTGEPSDRGRFISSSVEKYLSGEISKTSAIFSNLSPVAKMFRSELVYNNRLKFDEVIAANDAMFSTYAGYYSKHFSAVDKIVYTITASKGSLIFRRDNAVMESRYRVSLARNKFLKEHGLASEQGSVMRYLHFAMKQSPSLFFKYLILAVKSRQNIFIGYKNWLRTAKLYKNNKKDKSLITQ